MTFSLALIVSCDSGILYLVFPPPAKKSFNLRSTHDQPVSICDINAHPLLSTWLTVACCSS